MVVPLINCVCSVVGTCRKTSVVGILTAYIKRDYVTMEAVTWSVIKFPDEGSVEAVPSSWILDENQCYWPPYNAKMNSIAIEQCETPDENWKLYPCIGFRNNVYDNFKEASKKSFVATNTSDLESAPEEACMVSSKKRKIFRKTFSFSSIEEQDDTSLLTPPAPNYHRTKGTNIQSTGKTATNVSTANLRVSDLSLLHSGESITGYIEGSNILIQPAADETPSTSLLTVGNPVNTTSNENSTDQKKIIKYLEMIIRKLNILQTTVGDIGDRISHLEKKDLGLDQISEESIFTAINNLPADNSETLPLLEDYLTQDMDGPVKEVVRIRGRNLYEFVMRVIQKFITDGFCGQEYSFEGRRIKKSFRTLKLNELLTNSAMILFPNITKTDVETKSGFVDVLNGHDRK